MSDPRLTPFNGRVAHVSLEGKVEAATFTAGELMQVATPVATLRRHPDGDRDRELVLGRDFLVLDEETAAPWVFGISSCDGYCGWVDGRLLADREPHTHWVCVRESYLKATPDLKTTEPTVPVFLGSRVFDKEVIGEWAKIARHNGAADGRNNCFLPVCHLRSAAEFADEPVQVARQFLGTPYLWGGNSGRGLDCSGLVQAAYHACGFACPGDSDLQEAMPGERLDDSAELNSGDLIFWNGHVALVTGPDTMIHTNAHHMNTVEEPIEPAIARIAKTDTGPVTSRLRPKRIELPRN